MGIVWDLLNIALVRDSSANPTNFIFQILDITKRKLAESKLTKITNELKDLNLAKNKFFSIISHDLRSPFNALLGISEYATRFFNDLSRDEIKEALSNVRKSSKKVYDLMQNLLEWAQNQSSRLNVKKSKVYLYELAENVTNLHSETVEKKMSI